MDMDSLRGAAEGEIGKKKYRKRTAKEKVADFEFVMEMCLAGKSRHQISGEFNDNKPYRPYTLHWGTVARIQKQAEDIIIKNTLDKDRTAEIKSSKALYKKIINQALEQGDLRVAVSAQDKMDYHHISKQPDQINIQELRMQILGDGEGIQSMHICGDTIEPALVRYQYVGQDEKGNMVVWAEEEITIISNKEEAESKVHVVKTQSEGEANEETADVE